MQLEIVKITYRISFKNP